MPYEHTRLPRRHPSTIDAALQIVRESWPRDGAEGESVHALCDEIEYLREEKLRSLEQGDHIYVAGPLGAKGLAWRNVREACLVGAEVFKEGFNPYVPHLMMTFDMIVDLRDEAKYRAHGLSFVPKCSGVVVFGFEDFESLVGGTKGEVDLALELGIPVWYGLEAFKQTCLFLRRRQRRNLLG